MEERYLANFVEPLDSRNSRVPAPASAELLHTLSNLGGPDVCMTDDIRWAEDVWRSAPGRATAHARSRARPGSARRKGRRTSGPTYDARTGHMKYSGVRRDIVAAYAGC